MHKYTQEQQFIIEAKNNPLKVIAFAGTGKTSTLEAKARSNENQKTLYIAFNKSVEQEAKRKFPCNVTSKTIHALAYHKIGRNFNLGKLSPYIVAERLNISHYSALLAIRTIENWCNSAETEIQQKHTAFDFLQEYLGGGIGQTIKNANILWRKIQWEKNLELPMPHSGYLKLYQLEKPKLKYHTIFIDEAQDTNEVTHDIIMSQSDHSNIIAVGDPRQAIYGWRGATNALEKIKAHTLYLTQSFRFGQELAQVANHILSVFFNETKKIHGTGSTEIRKINEDLPYTILTRTNAYLFKKATEISKNNKINIIGSQNKDLPMFKTLIDTYNLWDNKPNKITDPEIKCFGTFKQAQDLAKTECLDPEHAMSIQIVEEYEHKIPNQIETIKNALVTDPADAHITLTTAHKAKGLEWNQIKIGDDFPKLFKSKNELFQIGNKEDQLDQQEINLIYVAITRARKTIELNYEIQKLLNFKPKQKTEKATI